MTHVFEQQEALVGWLSNIGLNEDVGSEAPNWDALLANTSPHRRFWLANLATCKP